MNEQLKNELRKLIRKFFETGRPEQLLKKTGNEELKKIMQKYGTEAEYSVDLRDMIRETQQRMLNDFQTERLGGAYEMREANATLNDIMRRSAGSFKSIDRSILRGVMSGIEEGMKGDLGWRDTARAALRRLDMKKHNIETEINTTQAALDNTVRFSDFSLAGVRQLKYVGPSGTVRPFCAAHINKVYTIEEVKKMVNGFGQPALAYAGGYNCRHRWAPVGEANVSPFEPDQKFRYSDKDLKQDAWKHMPKFKMSDPKEYEAEAVSVALSPRMVFLKEYKGVLQYWLTGKRGAVIVEKDGTIKGYFFHKNIRKTERKFEEDKEWIRKK